MQTYKNFPYNPLKNTILPERKGLMGKDMETIWKRVGYFGLLRFPTVSK
jgi:hypothetical protein